MVEGGHPMGVRLTFEITSPLEPEDRALLTGLSIMTLAIANHEMAKERFPETFPPEDEEPTEPLPCSSRDPDDPTRICVSEVGHKGRHKFRQREVNGLAN
jgi:hypothetical protein